MSEYLGKIYWSWGTKDHRFNEIKEVYLDDKSELNETLKQFILKMTRDYAYDCNRLNEPLNPRIGNIELIPIKKSKWIDFEDTGLQDYLDNEIEWYGQLIEEGKAYINDGSEANYEVSPKNK